MTGPTTDEAASPKFIGRCRGCGLTMILQSAYLTLPPDQRAGRPYHLGHRLCATCHGRATRAGTIPFPAPPPTPRVQRHRARPAAAMEHARRGMRQMRFAQTPKACTHDNGLDERRIVRTHSNRTVKRECHECGLHLGYHYPDNPALPTADELLLAFHGHAPWPQPYTWGVARFKRLTAVEWWVYQGARNQAGRWLDCWIDPVGTEVLLSPRDVFTVGVARQAKDILRHWDRIPQRDRRSYLVEIPPAECPQGHTLGPDVLIVRRLNPGHRSHTYTCRLCNQTDPYTATWRPAVQ